MVVEGSYSGAVAALMHAVVCLVMICVLTVLTINILTLCVEILSARRAFKRLSDTQALARSWPRVAVLVPAHNESAGIIPTLGDAKSQLRSTDRLLVVADNCNDDTAEVARLHGAEVFERKDPERRGKGYALSAGIEHLRPDPPEIVIVVDADCRISSGSIERLAATSAQYMRPVQANYIMNAPPNSTLRYEVAVFAWRLKNFVRPLGLLSLGLPCQLTGSGMAFPWSAISKANLASGNIVEDMALGVELTIRGEAPFFCPQAEVTSTFPDSKKSLETQRRRWEHGHLQTIFKSVAPLILSGIAKRSLDRIALAMDLAVPPVSALAILTSSMLVLTAVLQWLGFSPIIFFVAAADAVALLLALTLVWLNYGRDVIPVASLPAILPYLISQARVFRSILVTKGPAAWTPTDRK